jgi:leucyl-tRNA synthetase
MSYPFLEIEPKWQAAWQKEDIFKAPLDESRPKYYVLDMFPYPSSSGLHVGHVEGYTASDIVSRYKRMQGFNVIHPMGWDAFGLPAEQYAIKTGIHPEVVTKDSIQNFKRQLNRLGFSYDWSREISTCDPKYYKWTQWIFKKLFEKGLAYQKEVPVNWCPALKTVLANEEVVDGKSERGGHPVEKRLMKQWMLKITAYADQLLEGLDEIDWLDRTKEAQRNWIGRSVGLQGFFPIQGHESKLEIFTTRPDTLWGVTFMVMSPEHNLVQEITTADRKKEVEAYQKSAAAKLDVERQATSEKTGVFTGAYAINPVNGEEIPIWISDYVLMDYGTGAIMAVPAHDERDFEFANAFDLPIKRVIEGGDLPYTGDGVAVASDFIDGMKKEEAIEKVVAHFEEHSLGHKKVQYRLRDWNFSRQRFWGEPFPIVHGENGAEAVSEDDLPVMLPNIKDFEPNDQGEPPLAKADEAWLKTDQGLRETQTMPGYAGSSWYFLRFIDPHNENEPFSKQAEKYFMPVDLYLGGAEHTVGHLLYARFWQHFFYDLGLVAHKEPFKKLVHQGMILGPDGEKMSKSRGNVVNPDDVVQDYGADALRVYEMFMGPLERDKPWNQNGLVGVSKFLNKIWRAVHAKDEITFVVSDAAPSEKLLKLCHQTIKKVTHDIENLAFNTAVSQLMIFANELAKCDQASRAVVQPFMQLLAPFAPHLAEEIWQRLGEKGFVSTAAWPRFDEELAKDDLVTIAIQVRGKTRAKLEIEADSEQAVVEEKMRKIDYVRNQISEHGEPKKIIFVKNRIVNLIF